MSMLHNKFSEGIFKDYDSIIFMVGLNLDKRMLNTLVRKRGLMSHSLILTSNISDAQTLMLIFNRYAFGDEPTPFAKKYIHLFYGDSPYSDNKFVPDVYIWVPDSSLAQRLDSYSKAQWSSGKWGWWILSYVFAEIIKSNEYNINEIEVVDNSIKERDRLDFLCKLALPSDIIVRKSDEPRGGDIKVAYKREYLPQAGKCFKVKISRIIPSFNIEIIKNVCENIARLTNKNKKILMVTLGGAEHNIYLNFFTTYLRRKDAKNGKCQILHDARNVFDFDQFQNNRLNKVLLETHNYINVYLQTLEGPIILSREGNQTGGIIVKISNILTPFLEKETDLLIIIGCGRYGALATKLTLARLLVDDTRNIKCKDGIYYVLYSDSLIEKVKTIDVIFGIKNVVHELGSEEIKEANYVMPIP